MKKKDIEIILSQLKTYEKPRVELEQYETPSEIISDIINELNLLGLIEGKEILEIACGTGKFSIALSFFNPKKILAFDIDKDAIRVAKFNYELIKSKYNTSRIDFLVADATRIKLKKKFDLIVMNPPFGIQGNIKDIEFLKIAFENSDFVVSIHPNGKNLSFFQEISRQKGFEIIKFKKCFFRIGRIFPFHRKKYRKIEVLILFFKKI